MNVIEAAHLYANKGFYVFPTHGIDENNNCKCKDGINCKHPGKHPKSVYGEISNGSSGATDNHDKINKIFEIGDNISINPEKSLLIIIDIDTKDGQTGKESVAMLEKIYGGDLFPKNTLMERTGSGGLHLFYRLESPINSHIPKDIADNVEVKYNTSVTISPSKHACGNNYEWLPRIDENGNKFDCNPTIGGWSFDDIAFISPKLLDLIINNENHNKNNNDFGVYETGEKIKEGKRHLFLVHEAGELRRKGKTGKTLFDLLCVINKNCIEKPVDNDELWGIAEGISRDDQYGKYPQTKMEKTKEKILELADDDILEYGDFDEKTGEFKFDTLKSSKKIIELLNITICDDTVWCYDEKTGLYRDNLKPARSHINEIAKKVNYSRSISYVKGEICKFIEDELYLEQDCNPFVNKKNGIPLKNGVLVVDEFGARLEDYTKEHYMDHKLPIIYDPTVKSDVIKNMAEKVFGKDKGWALTQMVAQALMQQEGKTFKKAYFLIGPSGTGKSTVTKLLRIIFGKYVSNKPLQELSQRFAISRLENMAINYYDDLGRIKFSDWDIYKSITGEAERDIEKKGKDIRDGFVNPVLLFTMNQPPESDTSIYNDAAFWSRTEVIECNNIISSNTDNGNGVNSNYMDETFTDENIAGFINHVIKYMIYIKTNGGELMNVNTNEHNRQIWFKTGNPTYMFMQHCFTKTFDENDIIPLRNIYEIYKEWSQQDMSLHSDENLMTWKKFNNYIGKLDFNKKRIRMHDKQLTCFTHIATIPKYHELSILTPNEIKLRNVEESSNFDDIL